MGFFDFLKQANINQGIEKYKRTAGAVLLDDRALIERAYACGMDY